MENKSMEKANMNTQEINKPEKAFQFPQCQFAATCGDCYYNDGGWCKRHGGWVDADKWACSSYSPR